jgi:hypothetical protein
MKTPIRFCLVWFVATAGCGGPQDPVDQPVLRAGAAAAVVTPVVEPFEDLNGNRKHDEDEPFTDLDGDQVWDPVWMGGFGSERPALGIHDDLYARALVLERGETRIGIVSIDWVGLLHDHCQEFAEAARVAGLELDHLIVTSTHNHEAPDTMGLWGPIGTTGRDDEYIEWAKDRTVEALQQAVEGLVPVRITAGLGKTEGLTSDSRPPEVLHEVVTALRFDRVDGGAPVAVVVHWSNHVESMDSSNRQITADFPASLVAGLEEAHPGTVGIFWQGIVGGLLHPLRVDVHDQEGTLLPNPSFERTARIGWLVAEEALGALESGQDVTGEGLLRYRQRSFLVPLENLDLKLAGLYGMFSRRLYDEDGDEYPPEEVMNINAHMKTEVTVLDLGDIQIATVPGELYPELALEGPDGETYFQDPQDPGADYYGTPCSTPLYHFMRNTPYRIILGLANDEIGYIIPKCQFDNTPPYCYGEDEPQYGESVSVGPDVAPILNRILAEELGALNEATE